MGPATRYVVRSTGCGRFIGLVLIIIGLVILFANSGLGPSWHYRRWWPAIIIAFGAYMLIRNYWDRFSNRSMVPGVIDSGSVPRLGRGGMNWRPPGLPVVVIATGVLFLLHTLGGAHGWEIWAVLLIVAGALFLGGSLRASLTRT